MYDVSSVWNILEPILFDPEQNRFVQSFLGTAS